MRVSMVDIQSATDKNRRGKKKKKEEATAVEYNGSSFTHCGSMSSAGACQSANQGLWRLRCCYLVDYCNSILYRSSYRPIQSPQVAAWPECPSTHCHEEASNEHSTSVYFIGLIARIVFNIALIIHSKHSIHTATPATGRSRVVAGGAVCVICTSYRKT